jgi:hypothetical protein
MYGRQVAAQAAQEMDIRLPAHHARMVNMHFRLADLIV